MSIRVQLFYDNQKINTSRKVSIRSDGEDVFSILEELFEDTNVTYKVLDNSIILSVTIRILQKE